MKCSDLERDMHLFTIYGFQESNLLRFFLIFLQWYHHTLPVMLLRLPQQKQLYHVSFFPSSENDVRTQISHRKSH